MSTIFMNSKNSKTPDPHRLLLNLTDKINLRRKDKYIALSNVSIYYTWIINLKYVLQLGTNIWSTWWITSHIKYSRLFWIYVKKYAEKTDNPSIGIYTNKIENRITFRIKKGYYLELLTLKTMKLLGNTKSKIKDKKKNGENVPYLEITEVVLIHCNIVNNSYQQNSRVLYTFVPNNYYIFHLKILYF